MAPSAVVKAPSTKKYREHMQGPRVDICVGVDEEKEHFSVPKALLCYYSRYFDRCFNGSFQEAVNKRLEIPEDDCEYFKVLLAVMLQGKPEVEFTSHLTDNVARNRSLGEYVCHVTAHRVSHAEELPVWD